MLETIRYAQTFDPGYFFVQLDVSKCGLMSARNSGAKKGDVENSFAFSYKLGNFLMKENDTLKILVFFNLKVIGHEQLKVLTLEFL